MTAKKNMLFFSALEEHDRNKPSKQTVYHKTEQIAKNTTQAICCMPWQSQRKVNPNAVAGKVETRGLQGSLKGLQGPQKNEKQFNFTIPLPQ